MNMMEKFQEGIERVLVPLASKLNSQRHICAVRDAFILSFPLTMAGSLMTLLNFVLLSPDGFIAKLLRLESIIPNLADYQQIFSPVLKGSADILSILIVIFLTLSIQSLKFSLSSLASFKIVILEFNINFLLLFLEIIETKVFILLVKELLLNSKYIVPKKSSK